jgi:modulator of FtsH protease HflK
MSLNDPQWGRGNSSGNSSGDGKDSADRNKPQRPSQPSGSDNAPDLEELWRDFNRRLNNLFGKRGGSGGGIGRGGGFNSDSRGAGLGVLAILAAALVIWLGSGIYIVQEGQVGVVTTFGKYSESTPPGFRWRMPWPVQQHEVVDVFSVRTL